MVFPVTGHGYFTFWPVLVARNKDARDTGYYRNKTTEKKEKAKRILIQVGTFFFSFT